MFYHHADAIAHGHEGIGRGAKDFIVKRVRQAGTKRWGWTVRFIFG